MRLAARRLDRTLYRGRRRAHAAPAGVRHRRDPAVHCGSGGALVAWLADRDPAVYRRYSHWWTKLPPGQTGLLRQAPVVAWLPISSAAESAAGT
jgi:hypothetical protein